MCPRVVGASVRRDQQRDAVRQRFSSRAGYEACVRRGHEVGNPYTRTLHGQNVYDCHRCGAVVLIEEPPFGSFEWDHEWVPFFRGEDLKEVVEFLLAVEAAFLSP